MIIIENQNRELERKDWKFNKRNINRIAFEYDATVEDISNSDATLRDNRGRLLWATEKSMRFLNRQGR